MKHKKPRIAVIGSGVAGLASAWLLRDRFEVQIFEKNDYAGGHTNTVLVEEEGRALPVDTGFIVYNEPNYPHLTGLFSHLGIATQASDMSFGASIDEGAIEYAGSNPAALFAQRRNLVSIEHYRMLRDILRFNRRAKRLLRAGTDPDLSVGEFLDRNGFGSELRDRYLLPMAAAIWSAPVKTMLQFPLLSFARFYNNHGLLNLFDRPQWRTVTGGSRQYVERLLQDLDGRIRLDSPVDAVIRSNDGVQLRLANGELQPFDQVVLAGHADQTLSLLEDPSPREQELLPRFAYQRNRAILHSDPGLMPHNRKVWSSWNYLSKTRDPMNDGEVSVTYWMNLLQRLDSEREYFVSLNPLREPRPERVVAEFEYEHPVFDQDAMSAQTRLASLQGHRNTWFCGSYFGYGFHEDALRSAVDVALALGVTPPWLTEQDSVASEVGPRQAAEVVPQGA